MFSIFGMESIWWRDESRDRNQRGKYHLFRTKTKKNSIKSFEKAIKNTKRKNLQLKEEIDNLNYKNQFIESRLESLDFINYDQAGIAQFLDDILKNSVENDVVIESIKSEDKHIGFAVHIIEKEQIVIVGSGSFKGLMALVQYIDSLSGLLRIRIITIDIEAEKTTFELSISHYGVELWEKYYC